MGTGEHAAKNGRSPSVLLPSVTNSRVVGVQTRPPDGGGAITGMSQLGKSIN
jgi:hypothetical protein